MKNLVVNCLPIMLAVAWASSDCGADEVFFTGDSSDNWHDEDNWSDGTEPFLGLVDYFNQDDLTATYSIGNIYLRKLVVIDV